MFRARWFAVILLLGSAEALAESYGSPLENRIWDIATGAEIDRSELVARIAQSDVILLGEVHDNADAHLAQGTLVRLLEPHALAVEMIATDKEDAVNAFLADGGEPSGIGSEIDWNDSGWPDWQIYEPVFRDWRPGVVTGAGLPRSEVRRAMTDGAAAISLDPPMSEVLATPLDPDIQADIEADMITAHCGHLPKEMAPGMIEAQRLRDAALASAVLRAGPQDGLVAVIAGNGHVRKDRGLGTYLPDTLKIASVGILEADIGISPEDIPSADLPYDFVWFVPPAEREDPCAVFLKKE